jgi:hypothetical protein
MEIQFEEAVRAAEKAVKLDREHAAEAANRAAEAAGALKVKQLETRTVYRHHI